MERKQKVVVFKCQTLYSGDTPGGDFESVLGQEDGLERPTICTCELHRAQTDLTQKRGAVCYERQGDISRKLIQGLSIAGL